MYKSTLDYIQRTVKPQPQKIIIHFINLNVKYNEYDAIFYLHYFS